MTTHSQAVLSLSKMQLIKPASTYKDELIHVVCNGSIESFLESVFSDLEVCHPPEAMNYEETPLNKNEGTYNESYSVLVGLNEIYSNVSIYFMYNCD